MPINGIGVSGSLGMTRPAALGVRGPGSSIWSPNEHTNRMIQDRVVETVRFLHDAEARATGIRRAISNMPAAFAPRTASSSDTDALRVNSFTGQNLAETEVIIYQLATAQRNEGVGLNRTVPFEGYGTFTFAVEVDGETRNISFNVAENETITNQQFQQRKAAAINNANIGLTATVTTSGQHSTLNIVTRTTGAGEDDNPRFTITDVTGNAAEFTGINNIVQHGQDAFFYVNDGERQTSASNDVNLGGGLNVTFREASEEPVKITLGQDVLHTQNAVRNFVNQFNAMLDTATANSADRNTRALARQLESAARISRRALADVGINVGADGFLSIDATRMQTAAENGKLERFFAGGPNGRATNSFMNRVTRAADSVIRNPLRHVSPNATRLPGFNAAWDAIQRGNDPAPPPSTPSPFDAYSNMNDWMSLLFDSSR